ncbi:MAG: TerB family tellurite resistance protein [Planctomycetota bacterium]|jgi:tellurite resistance protein
MVELLIAILILAMAAAAIICISPSGYAWFIHFINQFKTPNLHRGSYDEIIQVPGRPNLKVLNTRVNVTREEKSGRATDVFGVEICGLIHAPDDAHPAAIDVSIMDVSEGVAQGQPVHSHVNQWQKKGSPIFVYRADLGKLPRAESILSDWMSAAKIDAGWLTFPRRGERELLFNVSILSRESGAELACSQCTLIYDNLTFGYVDFEENIQRVKTLAVALAFCVSAIDDELYDCEVELIKGWARGNIDVSETSEAAVSELEKALDKTVDFFRGGDRLDACRLCRDLVEITPMGERYDILDLCLRVAQAKGTATEEEVYLLKKLAGWLEVDMDRFRAMMEKILPANMHEVEDVEVILGVTSDMSEEKTREQLNKEYRKWNARVTSSDPEIQSQADHMLKLIAEARNACVA